MNSQTGAKNSTAMPLREKFLDPAVILSHLAPLEGKTIADFGCGAGYFTLPAAQLAGTDGRIFAIDILPAALEALESRMKLMNLSNITLKRANLENEQGSGLPAESIDWIILKDVLFQNGQKEALLNEARRVLRPGGKMLIVEWNHQSGRLGPDKKLRISLVQLKSLLEKANFSVVQDLEAGHFHYALVASK